MQPSPRSPARPWEPSLRLARAPISTDLYVALVAILTLMSGVIYILFGLLRLGFVSRFFAKPVLDGLIIGLGLFMIVGQKRQTVVEFLRRIGILNAIGEENLFATVRDAVAAVNSNLGPTAASSAAAP